MARTVHPIPTRTNVRSFEIEEHQDDILALRARGLSMRAISHALEHFKGVEINENRIDYALRRWGEGADPAKARNAMVRWGRA